MYYSIDYKTDKEVGNIFPQVQCLSQMHAHQLHADEFPSFRPILHFELERKAQLTDVLSQAAISAQGLLVSEQLKGIIEQYKIMKHKFYPATVDVKSKTFSYYWLHLVDTSFLHKIDYKRSDFFRTEYGFREDDIKLNSFDDYKKKKEKFGNMGTIESDFLFIDESSFVDYQLITFPLFDDKIYVSSKLFSTLQKKGIKGIEFKEATTINL